MKPIVKKRFQRQRRKRRVRAAILGTAQRPRLSVFRSTHHVYAQLVDDMVGCTLCAAGSLSKGSRGGGERMTKSAMAKLVGRRLAENAVKLGITRVVFDRNGYRYHGRIRALADGAREGGLNF